MRNKFRYPNNCICVSKNLNNNLSSISVIETKQMYVIKKEDIYKSNKNRVKLIKIQYLRRFFKLNIVKNRVYKNNILYSTLKELKSVLIFIDKYNISISYKYLIEMVNNNLTNLLRRSILLQNLGINDCKLNYIIRLGYIKGIKHWYNKKVLSFTGEFNPGFNHGGRLSSLSKNFKKYKDMPESEVVNNIKTISKKIGNTLILNKNCCTRLDYYTKRNYSEEEAVCLLRNRQSTFTLQKCIAKYGLDIGYSKWCNRQKRWQDTLNNKTELEKQYINSKKGKDKLGNYHEGSYFNINNIKKGMLLQLIKATLYYIKIQPENSYNTFYKIGITKNNVLTRFGSSYYNSKKHNFTYEIIFEQDFTPYKCYLIEQTILNTLKKYRTKLIINSFSTTEAFSEDVYYKIKDICSEII